MINNDQQTFGMEETGKTEVPEVAMTDVKVIKSK